MLLRTAAAGAIASLTLASPAKAIVPNDNYSPEDIVDNAGGVNGVGMFYRADGFVCTGTLINPRTVIFAAHCVNNVPQETFGPDGLPAAFSFNVNALPGFRDWIQNGYVSNPDLFVYNISQIFYDPASLARPEGLGFLEGDIALASLDTPASNVPTWALLFSALPAPEAITDADGTGYHVKITGYGRTGSGTAGSNVGIDWRRRAAENMLGSLSSFDARNNFLFGPPAPGDESLPQVLYRLDFDDPNETNPFDFNLYKDEARTVEGTTAGGDSGGPLILDAANNSLSSEDLVIGVLSGGSRFFGAQVFSSYGTESFYQPLFLFSDYIAATNPYRYVSAKAGDGAWENAAHWQTDLDPAYRIIDASGNVVNGFPGTQPGGINQSTPQFGEVCFDERGNVAGDGCLDLATGADTPPARNSGAAGDNLTSGIGQVNLTAAEASVASEPAAPQNVSAVGRPTLAENTAIRGDGMIVDNVAINTGVTINENVAINGTVKTAILDGAEQQPQAEGDLQPAPTLANGLAGATNFIPDNIDADAANGVNARYFEVTLNKAGTTTLTSERIIDRLNVGGAAGLNIAAAGNLTALNDVNQTGGRVIVDGALNSVGDYSLFSGMLSGSGTVTTPFLTNIAGTIAPGTLGGIGTLTIDGNAVLSSGSTLLVDLGAPGQSDQLNVTGEANVGGNVGIAPVAGFQTATPSTYRIVSADAVTGAFNSASPLSAILLTNLTYGANFVDLTVRAQSYQNVVNQGDPVQTSYAALLDRNRGNAAVAGLYSSLDFSNAATIQSTLASWAPTTESTVRAMGKSAATGIQNFFDRRLALADRSSNGGTIAISGTPVQTAALALNGSLAGSSAIMSDAVSAASSSQSETMSGGVNEDTSLYLAGGYLDGKGRSMSLFNTATGRENYDGFFIAGGAEHYLDENSVIGLGLYYSDVDADGALNNSAKAKTITGTLYGKTMYGGLGLDTQLTAGVYTADTLRNLALGGTPYAVTSSDDNLLLSAALDLFYELGNDGFSVAPTVGMRATKIDFSNVKETGGPMALTVNRPDYNSLQGRAGLDAAIGRGSAFQLTGSAYYVHEFENAPSQVGANFTNGVGLLAPFALAGQDENWFEVAAGLRYNTGNVSFDLTGFSTIKRYDAESRGVSAGVTFRF